MFWNLFWNVLEPVLDFGMMTAKRQRGLDLLLDLIALRGAF